MQGTQQPPTPDLQVASRVKTWLAPTLGIDTEQERGEQPDARDGRDLPESTPEQPYADYAIDWDADTQGRIHVTLPQWRQFDSYLECHVFEWGDSVDGMVEVCYVKSVHRNGQSTRLFRDSDAVSALRRDRDVIVSW